MKVSVRVAMETVRDGVAVPFTDLESVARMGFDGIELCLEASAWRFLLSASYSQEVVDQLKSFCQQQGLQVFSLSSDWAWAYASFFPPLSRWGRGVELIADDARLAQKLGAGAMLIHFATSKGSWEDCRALCKEVAAIGEETGVRLGYEANIWERLGFGGLDALCRMVDEVGSRGFGVYLHNSYPRTGLPLEQELAVAGPRLVPCMHSSSLVGGRVQIDWAKAWPAIQQYLPDCVYTFEVNLNQVEPSKRAIDQVIRQYS